MEDDELLYLIPFLKELCEVQNNFTSINDF